MEKGFLDKNERCAGKGGNLCAALGFWNDEAAALIHSPRAALSTWTVWPSLEPPLVVGAVVSPVLIGVGGLQSPPSPLALVWGTRVNPN